MINANNGYGVLRTLRTSSFCDFHLSHRIHEIHFILSFTSLNVGCHRVCLVFLWLRILSLVLMVLCSSIRYVVDETNCNTVSRLAHGSCELLRTTGVHRAQVSPMWPYPERFRVTQTNSHTHWMSGTKMSRISEETKVSASTKREDVHLNFGRSLSYGTGLQEIKLDHWQTNGHNNPIQWYRHFVIR